MREQVERNQRMVARRAEGYSYRWLGRKFGVCWQRVRQIVVRQARRDAQRQKERQPS